MARKSLADLSRRERQIMDIIYRRGEACVAEVLEDLPDTPSYSTVRALLRILEGKGHLKHGKEGPRYVYRPTRPRSQAARFAMKRLLETFFDGCAEKAVAALLDVADADLTPEQLDRLTRLIEKAKREGD